MSTVPPRRGDSAAPAPEGMGGSPLRSPSGPPLPAPRPPAPHPEPFLLVRLDLGVQLPQRVSKAAEEQVLPDQLVSTLHGLRHRCASAVSGGGTRGTEGLGLGRAGRGREPAPITSRRGPPTSPHASRAARLWPRLGPAPSPAQPLPSASVSGKSDGTTRCSRGFQGVPDAGFVI